jgi:hypothetical protein
MQEKVLEKVKSSELYQVDIPAKTATHSGLKFPPLKLHTTSDFHLT